MRMEVISTTRLGPLGEGPLLDRALPEPEGNSVFETAIAQVNTDDQQDDNEMSPNRSRFETIITSCTPILESFLQQCPTSSILSLYHTSPYLRNFLENYPLAWRNLSFKLVDANTIPATSSVSASLDDPKAKACDYLMQEVVVPFSLHLRSLDLDNTGVNGDTLTTQVLLQRRSTLEHLSVRGCRNVSLKYNILPHIELYARKPTGFKSRNPQFNEKFALKSVYVYRSRHHRRRPYLGSSADKTDSDSYATHKLVLECRRLGIWTDTGWCTTPAGRCQRRRSYANSRLASGPPEVWVPFDRLWRSKNRIGCPEDSDSVRSKNPCLWDEDEDGWDGEALGTGNSRGEGRMAPVHERRSHKIFVENIKCDDCNKDIPERCEQCSVLMHCAGCRKTLCYECAFDKKYHIDEPVPYLPSELWWAPGATQSPNLLKAPEYGSASSFPRIKMRWCCIEPMFSQGGGITFQVPTNQARKCDRIRAAPLPKDGGWEDQDFIPSTTTKTTDPKDEEGSWSDYKHDRLIRNRLGDLSREASICPRMFCESCYKSPAWKLNCNSCRKPLCNEHDLRGLRLRMCGYRDLGIEKAALKAKEAVQKPQPLFSIIIDKDENGNEKVVDMKLNEQHAHDVIRDLIDFYKDPKNMEAFKQAMRDKREAAIKKLIELESSPADPNDDDPLCSIAFMFQSYSPPPTLPPEPCIRIPAPPWYGCQKIYCPQYRPLTDHRPRCSVIIKECSTCHVYVCPGCRKTHLPCKCSYCSSHYNCPNCYRKLGEGVCRKAAEEEAERKRIERLEKEKAEREKSNEEMGVVGEFFERLLVTENEGGAELSVQNVEATTEGNGGTASDHIESLEGNLLGNPDDLLSVLADDGSAVDNGEPRHVSVDGDEFYRPPDPPQDQSGDAATQSSDEENAASTDEENKENNPPAGTSGTTQENTAATATTPQLSYDQSAPSTANAFAPFGNSTATTSSSSSDLFNLPTTTSTGPNTILFGNSGTTTSRSNIQLHFPTRPTSVPFGSVTAPGFGLQAADDEASPSSATETTSTQEGENATATAQAEPANDQPASETDSESAQP
jgi:hypothetical protein